MQFRITSKAPEKVEYLKDKDLESFDFEEITPDVNANWLNQSNSDFDKLLPLANRETKYAKSVEDEQAVFGLSALGVNTARDEWVYDFDTRQLRTRARFFAREYNRLLDEEQEPLDTVIKWSRDLRNEFRRGRRIEYRADKVRQSLYRPFVIKSHFADFTMNDVLTSNHYEMFGQDLKSENQVINICRNGRHFYSLVSSYLTDWHFTGDTHCLPLHRVHCRRGKGLQHNRVGHPAVQRPLPAGMGRPFCGTGRARGHHRRGHFRLHLRRAARPGVPPRLPG